ncbi:hypothetical protein D9M68_417070 [compost metagenome]
MAGVAVAAIGIQHQDAQAGIDGHAHAAGHMGRGVPTSAHAHHAGSRRWATVGAEHIRHRAQPGARDHVAVHRGALAH